MRGDTSQLNINIGSIRWERIEWPTETEPPTYENYFNSAHHQEYKAIIIEKAPVKRAASSRHIDPWIAIIANDWNQLNVKAINWEQ